MAGVSDQALDALIRRLRNRLAMIDPNHQYIDTVRGHGVRLDNHSRGRIVNSLKLLAVFAHPDDRSMGMGGTLAKYSAEGVDTHFVCASRGERAKAAPRADRLGADQ